MFEYIKALFLILFLMFSNAMSLENKIILKIDKEIITSLDVFYEMKNLKFFNKNLKQINDDEIYKIALQSIVKYKIKKNEILKFFKKTELQNEDYLNQMIKNTHLNLGFENLEDFKNELENKEISFEKFKDKIKIDILWGQIIYSKYYNKLVIDEVKLKEQIETASETVNSYDLKEIIFEVSDIKNLRIKFNLIKNDIEKLGFENAALKHSVSKTSVNGGKLGWIEEKAISSKILEELQKISVKSITEPIRISSGFLILEKYDEKKFKKNSNAEQELTKLIDYEKNQQLNNYSNLYYNKIKKDVKIDAP